MEEDAVIAVLLCENSITLKHGSFRNPKPGPSAGLSWPFEYFLVNKH